MKIKLRNKIYFIILIFLILLAVGFAIIKYLQEKPGTHLVISRDAPAHDDGRDITYIFNSSYGKVYFIT
jgi:hypothetical protein